MPNYNGSGPEAWVLDPSVTRVEGKITQQMVSARAIVLETNGGQTLNLGLTDETRIANASSTSIAVANFSTTLRPNVNVVAIVDLESGDTGTLLTIRVLP
jgi:hypothetical protein